MAKPNLSQLTPAKVRVEEKTFTSAFQPGVEFTFRARGAEPVQQSKCLELGDERVRVFVTGNPEKKVDPQRLSLEGLGAVALSKGQCRVFAIAEVLQCPVDEADKYTLPDLARLSKVAPDACEEASLWFWDLYNDPYERPVDAKEGPEGNEPGAPPITP